MAQQYTDKRMAVIQKWTDEMLMEEFRSPVRASVSGEVYTLLLAEGMARILARTPEREKAGMTKKEFQREIRAAERLGWNRGVRAAAALVSEWPVFEGKEKILDLLKPQLENPNLSVKR